MGENTKIEWCDHSFSPWWGCTKVSPGCDHCYAETWANRVGQRGLWGTGFHRMLSDNHWRQPLLWNEKALGAARRPRVFCASMADVFDKEAPSHERERLWRLVKETPNLDWLILTKRIGNVPRMMPELANVWLGISVVNQEEAERDIPKLTAIPAAIRFLSCEPLLGLIDLYQVPTAAALDWIIVGGESGAGARPMEPWWAAALKGYCGMSAISFFMKQGSQANWPEFKTFRSFPSHLQVREWPRVTT